MFTLFFIIALSLLISGSFYLLSKWNKKEDILKETSADDYLYADKIFVRDPEAFKDKDKDGIDDIIDSEIK